MTHFSYTHHNWKTQYYSKKKYTYFKTTFLQLVNITLNTYYRFSLSVCIEFSSRTMSTICSPLISIWGTCLSHFSMPSSILVIRTLGTFAFIPYRFLTWSSRIDRFSAKGPKNKASIARHRCNIVDDPTIDDL